MTRRILRCIKCGRKTDWEEEDGPEPICVTCWDAGVGTYTVAGSADDEPISKALLDRGIATGEDFARLMVAIMQDIVAKRLSVKEANALSAAAKNLLTVVELQYKLTSGRTMQVMENAQLQIMKPKDD